MEPRTRYAKAGDLNVAYQIVGEGPFDLVLSPGAWTHLDLAWDVPPLAAFLTSLAERSRLILFDKPGTGLSDPMPPDTLPTMEQRMEHLRAVMDAAGSERAVLLGTLGGGAMSGLFAATFPERTLGLILFGTFGTLEPDTGLLARLADSQEVALDRLEAEWGTEGVSLAFWAPSLVNDEATSRAYLRLARSAVSPGTARTLFRLGFQVDWEAVLPSIHVPTLVLHRSGDLVVPLRQGRKLAEAIPGARFVELPGVDHLIWAGDQAPVLSEIDAFIAELRPAERIERRLTTILFTDIVNSTDTAARLGDRQWRALLDEHHGIVREQLARAGGREVETTGDGFYALFDGPASGVRCAIDITRAVRSLGIEIRAGLHTGECEVRGSEVRGIAVAIGARVAARAGPSEVLVSSTVHDLVMGSGLSFAERGTHQLKGVPGSWTLYAAADGSPVATA